jgi:hypothetical protein
MDEAPSYWISALAEEAALLADNRDAAGLSAVLKQHAKYHGLSERDLTAMVAKEWERQGIARVPMSGILRGWIDA